MAADIDQLLEQAASQPTRQLDLAALQVRRRRHRDRRRVLGAGVMLILLAVAVVLLPSLMSTNVVFEPADQPGDTATTAPHDKDDPYPSPVPEPARKGDVIDMEGVRVPAPATDLDAP